MYFFHLLMYAFRCLCRMSGIVIHFSTLYFVFMNQLVFIGRSWWLMKLPNIFRCCFVMLGMYSCFKINVVEIVGFVHCLGSGRVCVMQCSIRFQRFQIKNSVFTSGCNLRKHRIAIHSRLKTILYSTPSGIS